LNGDAERRLPGNLNVGFAGVDADALLAGMPELALSSGSACSSAKPGPSHVLKALGLPDDAVRASIRIGLGRTNTIEEVDAAAERIIGEVNALRAAKGAESRTEPAA
jgi:cysteine desulfurase